jgi:hypothetical protein
MAKEMETPFTDDKAIALPDTDAFKPTTLSRFVEERFSRSKTSRRFDEERWLRAYRNYRGIYGPDMKFTDAEKSRVFLKITKVKTLAAYGQITDVLFANNSFPLSVEPTTLPEGVAEHVHVETNPQAANMPRTRGCSQQQQIWEQCLATKATARICHRGQHHRRLWSVWGR